MLMLIAPSRVVLLAAIVFVLGLAPVTQAQVTRHGDDNALGSPSLHDPTVRYPVEGSSPPCLTQSRQLRGFPVAYIYDYALDTATSFESFLDERGYPCTLIQLSEVLQTDFSTFNTILIGDDTGYLYWSGSEAAVDHIDSSGKPIVGLGEGGYAFFGELGLETGYPNGMHYGDQTTVEAVNPEHEFFHTPNEIPLDEQNEVVVYGSSACIAIHFTTVPPEVLGLGRVAANYYVMTFEQENYFLWGFSGDPAAMTSAGRDLFENAVYYVGVSIPGDLNGDGCVDHTDLGIILSDWGCTGGDCPGDCDGDGDTDHADLGILLAHWGEGCP